MELGLLPYINALPVTWGLESGAIPWPGSFRRAIPSQLSLALAEGDLPISLISSAAYLTARDRLRLFRGLSISAQGPVSSVILFSRLPRADIRQVAVIPDTMTSVAVLKALFLALWQQPLDTRVRPGDLEALLDDTGAVLWIGDQALWHVHHPPSGAQTLDVGELWWRWCGLPLPFAVWACQKRWADEHPERFNEVQRRLLLSKRWGLEEAKAVRQEAQRRLPLPQSALNDYYRLLNYDLSASHLLGLARLDGLLKLSLKAPFAATMV